MVENGPRQDRVGDRDGGAPEGTKATERIMTVAVRGGKGEGAAKRAIALQVAASDGPIAPAFPGKRR